MVYLMAMDTPPILPQQLWNQLPPEVQVYIRALEARLESFEALEAKVHTWQEHVRTLEEQLNQNSRNSSRPPSSDPPQCSHHVPNAHAVGAVVAVNRAIEARHVASSRWQMLPSRGMIRRHFVIKSSRFRPSNRS
jgi:hypothetical protein